MKAKKKVLNKKPQVNNKEKAKAKRAPVISSEDGIYSWRTIPISQAMIEEWTNKLSTWVQLNPEAKTITEFIYSLGLTRGSYYKLLDKHPYFKEEHEKAMARLGERLWGNAVDKKADWSAVRFMIHSYSPEFDEAKKYETALKEKIAAAGGIRVVEIPAFEEVPAKKDKK